ncbi:four helix bundle protein [Burkholderia sp. BCC1985]|uniref:four helix bundle protein n=1 Tax=Burkholderia sp. BCC1985 TaxID=2817442 RepID=UPI002AB0CC32|nr:four helix bundle protein [Burkholderia sp. BCC1985]
MALHTTLDIYKTARKFTTLASRLVGHMPRNHRSVDGALLVNHSRAILKHIRHANQKFGAAKVPHIDRVLDEATDAHVDLGVCVELKLISPDAYADAVELVGSIGKQAMGWRNRSAQQPVSRSPR